MMDNCYNGILTVLLHILLFNHGLPNPFRTLLLLDMYTTGTQRGSSAVLQSHQLKCAVGVATTTHQTSFNEAC